MLAAAVLGFAALATGQSNPPGTSTAPQAATNSSAPAQITLDDAIRMSLLHNHALQAMRIDDSAESGGRNHCESPAESDAGSGCAILPIFQPTQFSSNYIDQQAQFDAGVGYLFERGKKRQHRLQSGAGPDDGGAFAGVRQRTATGFQCRAAIRRCAAGGIDAGIRADRTWTVFRRQWTSARNAIAWET